MGYGQVFLSVDLDGADYYHQLYGLGPAAEETANTVFNHCLPRLLDVLAKSNSRATFFIRGRDLKRNMQAQGQAVTLLKQALKSHHELANHSYEYQLDSVAHTPKAMYEDLARCDDLLRQIGTFAVGFRAPKAYPMLLQQVSALGYRYDSSLFPSAIAYLGKRALLAMMHMRGEDVPSIRHGWQDFLGPAKPHYVAEVGLWEIPINFRLFPEGHRRRESQMNASNLLAHALGTNFLHLQLYAIDFAEDSMDGRLCAFRKSLTIPLAERLDQLNSMLQALGPTSSIVSLFS